MYLRKVHIENIRSIAKLDWEIPEGQEAGWHVVIGDNGSGKSAFLRAIALVLVGENGVAALGSNGNDWLRKGESHGLIQLELNLTPNIDRPRLSLRFRSANSDQRLNSDQILNFDVSTEMVIRGGFGSDVQRLLPIEKTLEQTEDALLGLAPLLLEQGFSLKDDTAIFESASSLPSIFKYLQTEDRGCFSAAYGPFRRFTGGDQEKEKVFSTNPHLSAHLSIFGENIALTESLKWLQELKFKQLEKKPEGKFLDWVKDFVNQEGFLPHHAHLTEISSDGVIFTDGDERRVPVEELSDGYRSILSMTFELIRQMSRAYPIDKIFSDDSLKIIAPGVVLIDEVDAHLHPTWQRRIGLWFREHFPKIQFIVTTHSPLVCQAAEHGTVFRLPAPGSEEQAGMVNGIALQRLLYGDVLDAYGTALFGEDVGRSERGQEMMEELAELNVKEVNFGLSKTERAKQQTLRAAFPTMPYKPLLETARAATNGRRKEKRK